MDMRLNGIQLYAPVQVQPKAGPTFEDEVFTLVDDLVHMNFCQNEAGLHWARMDAKKHPRKLLKQYWRYEDDENTNSLVLVRKNAQLLTQSMVDALINCLEQGGAFYVDQMKKPQMK